MANQNLSQFGEKLFVADADHTFIWDSAVSISKRVSRNSWLNSGTLTSDAPVTISQTWDQIGTAFTALKVNAVSTASATGSLLLDLQLGGATKFKVDKASVATLGVSAGADNSALYFGGANYSISLTRHATGLDMGVGGDNRISFGLGVGQILLSGRSSLAWSDGNVTNTGTVDTILLRDGAPNTLALRNGAAAQTFNVYGTYTSASVYERMFMRYNDTDLAFQVGAETLGATARPLQLWTGGASRLHITTAGNVGIGTTAPSEKLHVLGGKVLFGDISDPTGTAGNGELTLHARTLPQLNMVSNVGVNSFFGLSLKAGTTERAGFLVNMQSGEVKMGALSGAGYFPTFWSNGVEIMRFSTAGNVGIGTTSPSSKLHVALNPAANYTTETVKFGNIHFGNGTGDYTNIWIGSIATPLTLTSENFTLASNGAQTILHATELYFRTNGVNKWTLLSDGHLRAAADNTYDIGANGANRPRNLYLSGFAVAGSSLSVGGDLTVGDTKLLGWISGRSIMSSPADGYIRFTDSFQTNFNRLQFGGTSASFPALKRVGTDLQVVVANTTAAIGVAAGDADLTFIEDRYRRKGAGDPNGTVTAPIGAVYHNTTGGAGTSFYVKESGTGNTGWVGK